MSTEFLEDLGDMAATLTGSSGVADDASDDTELPNALAAQVEEYDRFVEGRDAHLADAGGEEADAETDPTPKLKHVPLSALKEERQRRQQMAAQLEQERAQHLALQQQVNQYLAQQQQAEQAAQIPDFADDPEGHVKGLAQQFEQRLTDMQGQQQQVVQQQQVQQTIQAAVQAEAAAMERFGEADYRQASALVEGNVMDQLRTMHPGAPEWQLQQVQAAATVHFVRQCQAQGIDPCEHIYNRAQQLGFKPGHRVPQSRPVAPTSLSSLPGAGGVEAGGKLTAAKINDMSDAEFAQLCANMKRSAHAGPGV
ncbi:MULTISPECIES: hypothetical protein [Pseudomonas]|uniref:hypothetical protein n=1 Tax=Pseudomonas TaxID=286 RepID=UPI0010BFB2B3|nr:MULTISPECIES: hypothetical protein [Pseudomonas]